MRALLTLLALALLVSAAGQAQRNDFDNLLADGLERWRILGDGIWRVRSDGVLEGYRRPNVEPLKALGENLSWQKFHDWELVQSWLYTVKEFEEFDLHLDYWVRTPGNSGVSIRDQTAAAAALTTPPDFNRTPSKVGYEIQINSQWPDSWPTGSIYGLARGKTGLQRDGEWNSLNIESRRDVIRVYVNGLLAAEHPGDPQRPLRGPIGLQLHDQSSVVMFKNVWLLERR